MNTIIDIQMPVSFSKSLQPIHAGIATENNTNDKRMFAILVSCTSTIESGEVTLEKVKFNIIGAENAPVTFDVTNPPQFLLSAESTPSNRKYVISGKVLYGTGGIPEFTHTLDNALEIKEGETIETLLDEAGICCGRICRGIFKP